VPSLGLLIQTQGLWADLGPIRDQVIDVAPDGLLGRVAEQLLGSGIPRSDPPVEIGRQDGLGADLEERLEKPLLPLELGDVVVDAQRPHRGAVYEQRSGQHLDVDEGPILPGPPGHRVDPIFPGHALADAHGALVQLLRLGHEVVDVSSDRFRGRVPEQPLGRGIPGHDGCLEVGDDRRRGADLE
jgi:hypothetical protein